jgi:protein ImuB
MQKRFVVIWFRHLVTDWMIIKDPQLANKAFVIVAPDHGRMIITEPSFGVVKDGICAGMIGTDARIIIPGLELIDEPWGLADKAIRSLCKWCIRFTPIAASYHPNDVVLDVTGCTHLWGNEAAYLEIIISRLTKAGYHIRAAMSDTIGSAWAIAHYGTNHSIIESGRQREALLTLPPEALRINEYVTDRLHKLGLHTIRQFIAMPRSALRRRFGNELLLRLGQALGPEEEFIQLLVPVESYHERLNCLEPIVTATGIEIALQKLLDTICMRLQKEGEGIRAAVFTCYRLDNRIETIRIGTNHASNSPQHLYHLFEEKTATIAPGPGIELFVLEAPKTEKVMAIQESLLSQGSSLQDPKIGELLDRITNKLGNRVIHRYLPDEHHWPEHSIREAASLQEKPAIEWQKSKPRPIHLLPFPKRIEVMAPIPDYPPIQFRYNGKIHYIKRADGPERIEREWWIEEGLHRDYYMVEDEKGKRYWLFRSGHYTDENQPPWFLHGFFA